MSPNLFNNPRPDVEADAASGRKKRRRPKRLQAGVRPKLTVEQILAWADAHHQRTGKWPKQKGGPVGDVWDTTWSNVDDALRGGHRGLADGSSLAQLLKEHRGARNLKSLPRLTDATILAWADAHYERTGKWPKNSRDPVGDEWGTTWMSVNQALRSGLRGLPGGSSLARLLSKRRGVRNHLALPPFDVPTILAWADVHHAIAGRWPNENSGPVSAAAGETWNAVVDALRIGLRGLPGGSSLARLLAEQRGVRNEKDLPRLTEPKILKWADAHFKRTGRWPNRDDGAIPEAPGETWGSVSAALHRGRRGFSESSSLARLFAEHRGARNKQGLPRLTLKKILAWADAHHRRTGQWPKVHSGAVVDAPGETWLAVGRALISGRRGMPGGSSLAQLLAQRRGVRNRSASPRLREARIVAWARSHRRRMGKLPTGASGSVAESPDENWQAIQQALVTGVRGLPGGSSLAQLLKARLGGKSRKDEG